MFCYLFSSCPAPLGNISFISLGMGEQLPVCACTLVFPSWQALCWLHSPVLGAMLTRLHLFGNFREGISFPSLPLSHWMQAIQNMYMQSYTLVEERTPNKIAALGSESVWVLKCSLIKISWSKSCCLCRGDDSFFTTFCSLPSFLVASCLKKKICCCGFIPPWFWGLWYRGKGEVIGTDRTFFKRMHLSAWVSLMQRLSWWCSVDLATNKDSCCFCLSWLKHLYVEKVTIVTCSPLEFQGLCYSFVILYLEP